MSAFHELVYIAWVGPELRLFRGCNTVCFLWVHYILCIRVYTVYGAQDPGGGVS